MASPYSFFIGLRYMQAKKQGFLSIISFISIAGIALGVAALIVVISVMNGFDNDIRDRIIGTNAIFHKELLQKEWYIQADVTGLFAQIISLVHHDRSLSSLLDNRDVVARLIRKQMDKGTGKQGSLGLMGSGQSPVDQSAATPPEEVIPYGAVEKK